MNDLIRPTLYDSFHRIWPVAPAAGLPAPPEDYEADNPGHVRRRTWSARCASRATSWPRTGNLPPMNRGDLLATFSAGAYGMAMSSNYNSRLPGGRGARDRPHAPPDPPPRDVRGPGAGGRGLQPLTPCVELGVRACARGTPASGGTPVARRLLFALPLAVLCPLLASGQQTESEFYATARRRSPEFWRAAQFEIRTGSYERAAERIKGLLDLNPDDKTLFDLVDQPPPGTPGGIGPVPPPAERPPLVPGRPQGRRQAERGGQGQCRDADRQDGRGGREGAEQPGPHPPVRDRAGRRARGVDVCPQRTAAERQGSPAGHRPDARATD